jgi:hypothetical protein
MRIKYEKPAATTSSKCKIEPPMETRHNKKQKEKTSQEMQQVEYDGLYVGKK